MSGYAIFLSGPIGSGKSTLGRELATRLRGAFLDGDDFKLPDSAWYRCILQTSRGIVRAGMAAVARTGTVVVAYPLRRTNWVFFKRSFEDQGVKCLFVSLRASYAAITAEERGRLFSDGERQRIRAMIAKGYGARPFGDLTIDTDAESFSATVDKLECNVRDLMKQQTSFAEAI